MYSPHPSLPYEAFRQACRAFRPSDLLPALARVSAALGEPPYSDSVKQQMPPWGLAAAARESLLYGNEHRSAPATDKALLALMRKFAVAMDVKDDDIGTDGFLISLITRLTYEQFPYQESMFEEVSRSHALLVEGLPEVETKVITEAALSKMLDGMSLREAIGATFLLQVCALQNGGVYKPDWLDQPNFVEVLNIYPRANIQSIATRLTTTREGFGTAFRKHSVGSAAAARFDYNPLVATPFVDMGDGEPVAPATRLILRTVTPGGLYYAGWAEHGKAFADDLGHLFEHYIGRQLKLIDGAHVEPEIVFGKGGGSKSVDWFVVLPDLVILVEAKSRRLRVADRAGDAGLLGSLSETLGAAKWQLRHTVECLADRHPMFAHIPTDRPILGLIVTAEPYYTAPSYLLDHDVAVIPGGPLPDVPVAAASARDIEALVTNGANVAPMLLAEMNKHPGGVVSLRDLGKQPGTENPILLNAWKSYPWPRSDRYPQFGGL